jgi:methionyl-tRNA formyltransferase
MRFAIANFDLYESVFDGLTDAGWVPVKLFTWNLDNHFDFNRSVLARADRLKIPAQTSRMRESDLADLKERGCDVLVVAGYPWRVPAWEAHLPHAINFHPSPLPEGRGPFPIVRAVAEGRTEWSVSCHRIDANFDTGAVLDAETYPLGADEVYERMVLRTQMAARRLAVRVGRNFQTLWDAAKPQGEGSYWPRWTDNDRVIDFRWSVEACLRHIHAYGPIEAIAKVNSGSIYIRRAVGWTEGHTHTPGTVVHTYNRWLLFAVADGYVGVTEWSYINPATVPHMGR